MEEEEQSNLCIADSGKGSKCKAKWTQEEDKNIKILVNNFGKDWKTIASFLPGRTEFQCLYRWKKYLDPCIIRDSWSKEEDEKHSKEHLKPKKMTAIPPPQTIESQRKYSSRNPSLSSPSSHSGFAPAASSADQSVLMEAALRMIAEDMLPLSFVEGAGFRSFMSAISPQHSKLSQRAVCLQLYNDVERSIKPCLIRDLKACLASATDTNGVIHTTIDLWVGGFSLPEPVIVVQLHFLSENWQICRPTVAFRHVSHKNLSAAVARELEGVLLSYGIFPNSIGSILANQAKEALAANKLFCDYELVCSSQRGEPDGDQMVAFLADRMPETESAFSELQIGSRITCVAQTLQLVIREALKNSRVVENLLSKVHNVLAFFRSNAYWSEV
ncbi:hypothetical protein LDENG_00113940 [Lucifuga dentata]|nr:hypothetical protein LDENG_00113940 [Lucifuga dentata]